jgi:RNA polymerase sigma factor (sigma-70 family)
MLQAEEDLLVISAQGGNHKAFNLLVLTYQKALLRFAYKLCHDHELANDAVQDCWIKVSKNLYQLKDPRVFKSWLYRTLKWRVTDLFRAQLRDKKKCDNGLNEGFTGNNQETDYVHTSDVKSELSNAIKRLPAVEKQMIHLFYLDEMKLAEISIILDIPVGTVKSRLNRARKLLQQKFDLS